MKKAILCLGRFGDILNALPIAEYYYERSREKPYFIVSGEFANVLDGVTYVHPVVWPKKFVDIKGAVETFAALGYEIIVAQAYGHNYEIPGGIKTPSFCSEVYRPIELLEQFNYGQFDKISIDKRFKEDEKNLVECVLPKNDLPIILLSMNGSSSRFPYSEDFRSNMKRMFGSIANIIDLDNVRARRLTDLLALYDKANLLVTIDTSTLHLAGASNVPYIAFIADSPSIWHGAYTRGNCILRVRYSEYKKWAGAIYNLIAKTVTEIQKPIRLLHVFHKQPKISTDTFRRNRIAQETWNALQFTADWKPIGLRLEDLPRTFKDNDREMAYVKDMIDIAFDRSVDGDVIMLCNSDTCISLAFYDEIVAVMKDNAGCFGSRRDFDRVEEPLLRREIMAGHDYSGTDVFIFTPEWWLDNRDNFPDFVVGGEAWDCVMREMMIKQGMPRVMNVIYHERHGSRWEQSENRYTLPMQKHNLAIAREALIKLDIGWKPGQFGIQ